MVKSNGRMRPTSSASNFNRPSFPVAFTVTLALLVLQLTSHGLTLCDAMDLPNPNYTSSQQKPSSSGIGKTIKRPFRRIFSFLPLTDGQSKNIYIRSLKEQILQMERQLRESDTQVRQLRFLLQNQNMVNRQYTSNTMREQASLEQHVRQIIDNLTNQIQALEETKAELEQMLKAEQERVAELETLLKEEKDKSKKAQLKSEKEFQEIRDQLLAKSTKQLKDMQSNQNANFQKELLDFHAAAERALEQERQKSMNLLEKERKALEEEREKGKEAVEEERSKMRKLVKALAEKERRDLEQQVKEEKERKKLEKAKEKKEKKEKAMKAKKEKQGTTKQVDGTLLSGAKKEPKLSRGISFLGGKAKSEV